MIVTTTFVRIICTNRDIIIQYNMTAETNFFVKKKIARVWIRATISELEPHKKFVWKKSAEKKIISSDLCMQQQ